MRLVTENNTSQPFHLCRILSANSLPRYLFILSFSYSLHSSLHFQQVFLFHCTFFPFSILHSSSSPSSSLLFCFYSAIYLSFPFLPCRETSYLQSCSIKHLPTSGVNLHQSTENSFQVIKSNERSSSQSCNVFLRLISYP